MKGDKLEELTGIIRLHDPLPANAAYNLSGQGTNRNRRCGR